jgi:hypothetical protein
MKCAILISMLCYLALAGIVSGTEVGVNDTGVAAAENAIENETTSYIFLQEGTNGSFVKDGSGNYTLTITGVIPYTVYFSDRPARDAGFAQMKQFINEFNFDPRDPPNAAVMLREGEEEDSDMIVVELTMPLYDETKGTLIYTASILTDYEFKSEWTKDLLSRADNSIPETFGAVFLVIDDYPYYPYTRMGPIGPLGPI